MLGVRAYAPRAGFKAETLLASPPGFTPLQSAGSCLLAKAEWSKQRHICLAELKVFAASIPIHCSSEQHLKTQGLTFNAAGDTMPTQTHAFSKYTMPTQPRACIAYNMHTRYRYR